MIQELATYANDPSFVLSLGHLPNPDAVLRKAGLDQQAYDQVLGDPHVMAKVVDRRAGMLKREWRVAAADDSAQAKKVAETCQLAIDRLEVHSDYPLEESLGILQEAALRGLRGLEVIWEVHDGLYLPAFLRDIPNRRLNFDGAAFRLLTQEHPNSGMQIPKRKVLMARHMATTDNPYGEALLSRCYWPYMFKHNGLKWWVTLAEKHGLPWVIGKLGKSGDDKGRQELLGQLSQLVLDAVAVVPEGAEIGFEGMSGVKADVHEGLIKLCNAELSKVLVGQTLSTELDQKGGSRAAAETHSGLRDEIVEADCKLVGRTMNRLLAWITEINYGAGVPSPTFKWFEEERPDKAWAGVAKTATESLKEVPRRWLWEKFGIPEEMKDEEMVSFGEGREGKGDTGGKEGKAPRTDFSASGVYTPGEFTPEQQALEDLMDLGLAEGVLGSEEKLTLFVETVQKAESYEDAFEMLLDLYPSLDVEQLEKSLEQSILSGLLFGRYTVKEETTGA